jgi:hypothetical protein
MRDIALAHGAALVGRDSGDGKGVSSKGHELDLERFPISVNVHHGPDITGFQTFGLNVGGQNHALVFLNAHHSEG